MLVSQTSVSFSTRMENIMMMMIIIISITTSSVNVEAICVPLANQRSK